MVIKILKALILLFGFFMAGVSFAFYMSIIGDRNFPDTVSEIMSVHNLWFTATFFFIAGLILIRDIWVRSAVAVFLLITYFLITSSLFGGLRQAETIPDSETVIQMEYAFVLHHRFYFIPYHLGSRGMIEKTASRWLKKK